MAICAALLVLAFEERIAGDSSGGPLAINPTGTNTPAGTCDTTYGPMTNKATSILHGGRIEKVTSSWQQGETRASSRREHTIATRAFSVSVQRALEWFHRDSSILLWSGRHFLRKLAV